MEIVVSLTLIVLLLAITAGICCGWNKGFAKSIANFIAFIATMFLLGIFLRIYSAYTHGKSLDLVIAIVVLIIFGAIYGIIRFVLKSVKAIAKLPIIFFIDKLLGAVLGVVVVISLYHIIVVLSKLGMIGIIGDKIWSDVQNSKMLSTIAKYDVIELIILLKNIIINKI